jgi:hypothetical protein
MIIASLLAAGQIHVVTLLSVRCSGGVLSKRTEQATHGLIYEDEDDEDDDDDDDVSDMSPFSCSNFF